MIFTGKIFHLKGLRCLVTSISTWPLWSYVRAACLSESADCCSLKLGILAEVFPLSVPEKSEQSEKTQAITQG